MSDDKKPVYPEGIMVFSPHEKAPDFVLASVIISPRKLFEWLKGDGQKFLTEHETHGKQLKLQMKKDKKGKVYAEIDTYVPGQKKEENPSSSSGWSDLPFALLLPLIGSLSMLA